MPIARMTLLCFWALLLQPGIAAADPRIRSERFNDWFYRCVEAENAKQKKDIRCEVVQIAQTKQDEKVINLLTISLAERTGNKKGMVLTMLTPLNVFLPRGLDLSVDNARSVKLQFRNCNNAGCWIQHIVDAKQIASLRGGQSGFAKFSLINGQKLNVKFSLKGISAALKSLQQGETPQKNPD